MTQLTARDVELVQRSFAALEPQAAQLVERFYTTLFDKNPKLRALFPSDLGEQKQKLAATLKIAVQGASDLAKLVPALKALGAKHAAYGVTEQHFEQVGGALLVTLADVAGPIWNEDLTLAWTRIYGVIASTMIEAMEAQRTRRLELAITVAAFTG